MFGRETPRSLPEVLALLNESGQAILAPHDLPALPPDLLQGASNWEILIPGYRSVTTALGTEIECVEDVGIAITGRVGEQRVYAQVMIEIPCERGITASADRALAMADAMEDLAPYLLAPCVHPYRGRLTYSAVDLAPPPPPCESCEACAHADADAMEDLAVLVLDIEFAMGTPYDGIYRSLMRLTDGLYAMNGISSTRDPVELSDDDMLSDDGLPF